MNDISDLIADPDKWPDIESRDHLHVLNTIADEAFEKHTIEGYLAALLIYHQLSEILVKVLIEDCRFYIRTRVHPLEIQFPKNKRAMFGRSLEALKQSVDFENKDLFIEKCEELNAIRNSVVHGLTKSTSLTDVKEKLAQVQTLHDEIYHIWDHSHDWFRLAFSDIKDEFEFNFI